METYGKILLVAMPAFLLLVLAEKLYGVIRGNDTVRVMDMVSSLCSGITNVTKDVLGLSIAILTYEWLVDHLAIVHISSHIFTYIIAFLALDLSGYWVHRIQHTYNIFWNNHIIHHSSEEFNLACALRQSISGFVRLFTVFLVPAALLGVPGEVIAVVAPLHLFAQFWYHTRHINRMGWLEYVIVTPRHHQVHHAINPEYLDKNFSQIFIFWDKLFGSFQEKLDDVEPVYGVTRPVQTWNPVKINFMHLGLLIRDAWHTRRFRDKVRIWFMPLGWRPNDVAQKYPLSNVEDVYLMEKYDPPTSPGLKTWCWVQLTFLLIAITYLFGNIAYVNKLNSSYIYLYGLFIFLSIYALTDLMDRNKTAIFWELSKNAFAIFLLYSQNDWFGASQFFPWTYKLIICYISLSTFITLWFTMTPVKQADKRVVNI